ncbi:MAG: adenylate/guanylate cyclase domain-containing protein, partial [Cyanobacteria bacterium P01_H01_bin.130]
ASPITERLGTLDKFINTMVMAFWGPPFAGTQNHAQLAGAATLAQRGQLMAITNRVRSRLQNSAALPPLQLCIGLATGSLVVGTIGSEMAKSYTVMGDTVNTASRLKGVSRQYGVDIVLMETTRDMLGDGFVTRELDWIQVVGKDEPVRIYELVGQVGTVEPSILERCKLFGEGLAAYRAQDWDRAIAAFRTFQEDAPAQLYCQRIEQLRDNPPPSDWDGVWQLTKK